LKIYNLATPTPTRAPRQCTYSPTYVVQFLLNSRPTFFANVFVNRYLDEIGTANQQHKFRKQNSSSKKCQSLFVLLSPVSRRGHSRWKCLHQTGSR
jgi:hypothetical protein